MTGCVLLYETVEADEVAAGSAPSEIETPLKVHLHDGSVVLFSEGARFHDGHLWGVGTHYSLALADSMRVDSVSVDRVAAMETFKSEINVPRTAFLSVMASGGVFVVSLSVLVAYLLLGEE